MMKKFAFVSIASLIFAASINAQETLKDIMKMTPPKAEKIANELKTNGDVRIDNYYWLNNPEDEKVINYLKDENTYYEEMTAHTKSLRKIFLRK